MLRRFANMLDGQQIRMLTPKVGFQTRDRADLPAGRVRGCRRGAEELPSPPEAGRWLGLWPATPDQSTLADQPNQVEAGHIRRRRAYIDGEWYETNSMFTGRRRHLPLPSLERSSRTWKSLFSG